MILAFPARVSLRPRWTSEMVKERLEEALDSLRRVRFPRNGAPAGHRSCMPDVIRDFSEAYGYNEEKPRLAAPSPREIEEMEDALAWLLWITPIPRKIVCLRCRKVSLRKVASAVSASHEWVRRVEEASYQHIAEELNKRRQNRPFLCYSSKQ